MNIDKKRIIIFILAATVLLTAIVCVKRMKVSVESTTIKQDVSSSTSNTSPDFIIITDTTTTQLTTTTTSPNTKVQTTPVSIMNVSATKSESTTKSTTKQHTQQNDTYTSSNDLNDIAKVLYAECGSVKSKTEQACVAWVILNRVDAGYGTIHQVVRSPNQFAFRESSPVTNELLNLATDVYRRWEEEKTGSTGVGRVLPKEYLWFVGNGYSNSFYRSYPPSTATRWDYSLPSPYSN